MIPTYNSFQWLPNSEVVEGFLAEVVDDENVGVLKSELVLVYVFVVAGDVVVTAVTVVVVTDLVDTLISENIFHFNNSM